MLRPFKQQEVQEVAIVPQRVYGRPRLSEAQIQL
jgi:hypothetical protein